MRHEVRRWALTGLGKRQWHNAPDIREDAAKSLFIQLLPPASGLRADLSREHGDDRGKKGEKEELKSRTFQVVK